MGLTYIKRYRMEFDLKRPLFRAVELPLGYSFVPWRESLLEAHAETKLRCFACEIDAHVFPSLGHIDGCLRLMREISGRSGFLPVSTWLLRHDEDDEDEFCGTIQAIHLRDDLGAVQNVGIVPEHRGRGLGTLLLRQAMVGFRQVGLQRASLEVTAKNLGAVRLYRRLGFRQVRTVYKVADVVYA